MKFTKFEKDVENISRLSDRPSIEQGYTAVELKSLFDKAGADIKEYINTILTEELSSSGSEVSGADRIGSGEISSLVGETVQEKLECLAERINELVNLQIPEGSITPEKFSAEISEFLTSASIRDIIYLEPGVHEFTAERAGTYKVTLVGGGGGGGVDTSNVYRTLGGGGGAALVVWLDLSIGDVCSIVIGAGGEGLTVNDSSELDHHARAGGDSYLRVNGASIAMAEGGAVAVCTRAASQGGQISYSGCYPQASEISTESSTKIEFGRGGDSILGYGGAFVGDSAGIGGGGFSGEYLGSGQYRAGGKGGDGAAVIEFIK